MNSSDSSIKDFIRFIQSDYIKINKSNAIELHYLAKEYEVSELTEKTNQYIIDHDDSLLKKYLINLGNEQSSNDILEDFITCKIAEFIHDEDLFKLPISSIYRIIKKSKNLGKEDKFNFLFDCLDNYGQSASILFLEVDFEENGSEYIKQILTNRKYLEIFNFSYFKPEFLQKFLIQNENQTNKMAEIIAQQKAEIDELHLKIKKMQIKEIKVLYIIPTVNSDHSSIRDPAKLDFISSLNTNDIHINLDTVNEDQIMKNIQNNRNFLNPYNVVIFGNGD